MFFSHTTYLGVDPTAGQHPFTYAALDQDLRLLALGHSSMDEVLAFVGGQSQAYVAVCSPRRPNLRIMERPEIRQTLNPQPRPGRWTNFRMAEYQLRQHNISCPKTDSQAENCPAWMRMGFIVYQRLEEMGYCPYPSQASSRQWLEAYPFACYCTLLGMPPLPKNSFEGRIQRQLVLDDLHLDVPDPMLIFEEITRHRLLQGILPLKDLYSPAELDALIAAYTAWLAANQPGQVTLLGHPEEGQVVVPVKELKGQY